MYDSLAPYYHLLYKDWESAITYQSSVIDKTIRQYFELPHPMIHDITCGVGTQLIGLLGLGYSCTGSDLSQASVERARREIEARGLMGQVEVADMSKPVTSVPQPDIILSWDNSLTHLANEEEILNTLRIWRSWARSGIIINIRNYEDPAEHQSFLPYGEREENGVRYFAFQSRRFSGEHYEVSIYIVSDSMVSDSMLPNSEAPEVRKFTDRYFMLSVPRLVELCLRAGFSRVESPDVGYHKPVIVARH